MAYNPNKDLKLYYSIGEVAEMFNVNESLLRFWEKEFPVIRPKKNAKGTRQYRKEDLENIRLIYHLVKEKGMTLYVARAKRTFPGSDFVSGLALPCKACTSLILKTGISKVVFTTDSTDESTISFETWRL